MNIVQVFILDKYPKLREIHGLIQVDEQEKEAYLQGTWKGRQIKISAHYQAASFSKKQVFEDFEYVLSKIEQRPGSCYPLLLNPQRRLFAWADPKQDGAADDIPQPLNALKKRVKAQSDDGVASCPSGKRQRVTFAESDTVKFIAEKVVLQVKRHQPEESLITAYELHEVEILDKVNTKTQENLEEMVKRLHQEAMSDWMSTHETPPTQMEIAEKMRELNVQKLQFTPEEFEALSDCFGVDLKKIPNDAAAKHIFKTPIKIKKLQSGNYLLVYRLIDRHVLEPMLPGCLSETA